MTNYGALEDSQKDTASGKLLTAVNKLDVDVASAYEDDTSYYIIIRATLQSAVRICYRQSQKRFAADEERRLPVKDNKLGR